MGAVSKEKYFFKKNMTKNRYEYLLEQRLKVNLHKFTFCSVIPDQWIASQIYLTVYLMCSALTLVFL